MVFAYVYSIANFRVASYRKFDNAGNTEVIDKKYARFSDPKLLLNKIFGNVTIQKPLGTLNFYSDANYLNLALFSHFPVRMIWKNWLTTILGKN